MLRHCSLFANGGLARLAPGNARRGQLGALNIGVAEFLEDSLRLLAGAAAGAGRIGRAGEPRDGPVATVVAPARVVRIPREAVREDVGVRVPELACAHRVGPHAADASSGE